MKFVAEFGMTRGHEKRILKGGGIKIWRPGSLSVGLAQCWDMAQTRRMGCES